MDRVLWGADCAKIELEIFVIEIGVGYQKVSTLEFNFHYWLSSHCVRRKGA